MNKEKKSFWEKIPEPVYYFSIVIAMIAVIIIIAAMAIYANNQYYGWGIENRLSHENISIEFPEELNIVSYEPGMTILFNGNSRYMKNVSINTEEKRTKISNLPIGKHEISINDNKLIVNVLTKAEMEAQQEPGFEGIAVIIAIICMMVVRKKSRR